MASPGFPQPQIQSIDLSSNQGKILWVLFYRRGVLADLQLVFEHPGTLEEANRRGLTHCDKMGYTFVYVRPFVTNLNRLEENRTTRKNTLASPES